MSQTKNPGDQYLLAIFQNDLPTLTKLIESGADVESLDKSGRTPLTNAAIEDNIPFARLLLERGAKINAQDQLGWTPLHFSASGYQKEMTEFLLTNGAKIDVQDSYGTTPLFRAVFESRGRGEIIELLRKHGADPHCANNNGVTPVSLAKSIGNYDVAQFFKDLE